MPPQLPSERRELQNETASHYTSQNSLYHANEGTDLVKDQTQSQSKVQKVQVKSSQPQDENISGPPQLSGHGHETSQSLECKISGMIKSGIPGKTQAETPCNLNLEAGPPELKQAQTGPPEPDQTSSIDPLPASAELFTQNTDSQSIDFASHKGNVKQAPASPSVPDMSEQNIRSPEREAKSSSDQHDLSRKNSSLNHDPPNSSATDGLDCYQNHSQGKSDVYNTSGDLFTSQPEGRESQHEGNVSQQAVMSMQSHKGSPKLFTCKLLEEGLIQFGNGEPPIGQSTQRSHVSGEGSSQILEDKETMGIKSASQMPGEKDKRPGGGRKEDIGDQVDRTLIDRVPDETGKSTSDMNPQSKEDQDAKAKRSEVSPSMIKPVPVNNPDPKNINQSKNPDSIPGPPEPRDLMNHSRNSLERSSDYPRVSGIGDGGLVAGMESGADQLDGNALEGVVTEMTRGDVIQTPGWRIVAQPQLVCDGNRKETEMCESRPGQPESRHHKLRPSDTNTGGQCSGPAAQPTDTRLGTDMRPTETQARLGIITVTQNHSQEVMNQNAQSQTESSGNPSREKSKSSPSTYSHCEKEESDSVKNIDRKDVSSVSSGLNETNLDQASSCPLNPADLQTPARKLTQNEKEFFRMLDLDPVVTRFAPLGKHKSLRSISGGQGGNTSMSRSEGVVEGSNLSVQGSHEIIHYPQRRPSITENVAATSSIFHQMNGKIAQQEEKPTKSGLQSAELQENQRQNATKSGNASEQQANPDDQLSQPQDVNNVPTNVLVKSQINSGHPQLSGAILKGHQSITGQVLNESSTSNEQDPKTALEPEISGQSKISVSTQLTHDAPQIPSELAGNPQLTSTGKTSSTKEIMEGRLPRSTVIIIAPEGETEKCSPEQQVPSLSADITRCDTPSISRKEVRSQERPQNVTERPQDVTEQPGDVTSQKPNADLSSPLQGNPLIYKSNMCFMVTSRKRH